MELYPSAKPLPKPEKAKAREAKAPPGAVRVSDYERRKFQETFKRPK